MPNVMTYFDIDGRVYVFSLYLIVVILARVVWILHYITLCVKSDLGMPIAPPPDQRDGLAARWARTFRQTSAMVSNVDTHSRNLGRSHSRWIARARRQFDVSVLGGAIALAAWVQLFSSSDSEPTSELSSQTMTLLFLGAAILIAGPFVADAEGRHLTYMVRESAVRVGFSAILLSLCSLTVDIAAEHWRIVAHIAAVLVLLSELMVVYVGCRVQRITADVQRSRRSALKP
ncbi:hypothetical protein [Streptomyces zaomyceticus]|uniref:hypothetical protein n=1 Tax=Streptomyces zaomyceticus TaxID=68286 RepID=UPI003787E121